MSPLLFKAGGALVAAVTVGVGVYAAALWWRTHDTPLREDSPVREWPVLWILAVVLLSRLWVLGIGSVGGLEILKAEWPGLRFINLWSRWDAPHYLDIARNGYQITGEARYFIVFYPLYPWLVRAVGWVTGDVFWAAMILSNACLAAACVLLYRLFRMDMDGDSAGWGIVFLCFSPLSFFLSIPYTESLYLLLTVCFFYSARKGQWLWAGIAGCLAAMSRNFGVLLLVPLAVYGIERWRRRERNGWWGFAACCVLIPAGSFEYLAVNQVITGDWWTFMEYQKEHWFNEFGFFGTNFMHSVGRFFTDDWAHIKTVFLPNVAAYAGSLGLLAYGAGKVPGAYLAYGIAYLIVAYSPTWLLSGGRYMLVLFPLWGILALAAKGTRRRIAVLAVLAVLSLYYGLLYATGHTVM